MVGVLKFIFGFRAVKYLLSFFAAAVLAGIYIGIRDYPFWWYDCLFGLKCYEKSYLYEGLTYTKAKIPAYIHHWFSSLISAALACVLFAAVGSYFGFGITWNQQRTAERLRNLRPKLRVIRSRFFLPTAMAALLGFGILDSANTLLAYRDRKLKISEQVRKEMQEFEERVRQPLPPHSFLFALPYINESSKVYFLDPTLRESLYDESKFFRFRLNKPPLPQVNIEKPVTDQERLSFLVQKLGALNQLFNLENGGHDPTALKLFGNQQYLVIKGRMAERYFVSSNQYLKASVAALGETPPNFEAHYLLKLSAVKKRFPLTVTATILAIWN